MLTSNSHEKSVSIINKSNRWASGNSPFVLITPCFNEEQYIRYALSSVVKQTVLPQVWVIVDDGSSDGTAKVVKEYAEKFPWIRYLYHKKKKNHTYYSSNVHAILFGMETTKDLAYSFLAILDADIELCQNYYEQIIDRLETYPELGIATGTYLEKNGKRWEEAKIDRRSTPKAIQVFRRECYEECGGYLPFANGGEDAGIEILARMKGWKTWSFDDIHVLHHRPVGTGDGRSLLHARFLVGMTDYCLGTHPFFMIMKSIRRMFIEKPFVLSGVSRMAGYIAGRIMKLERPLPKEAILFLRNEQLERVFRPRHYRWRPS